MADAKLWVVPIKTDPSVDPRTIIVESPGIGGSYRRPGIKQEALYLASGVKIPMHWARDPAILDLLDQGRSVEDIKVSEELADALAPPEARLFATADTIFTKDIFRRIKTKGKGA